MTYRRVCLAVAVLMTVAFTAAYSPASADSPQTSPVYVASTNFTADLFGEIDTRPNTWGRQDSHTWSLTFKPPAGQRVRVYKVYGDLISYVRPQILAGQQAGVLLALHTTAPDGSTRGDFMADNHFLYIQDVVAGNPRRAPFDVNLPEGVLLERDNVLRVKVAAWLNTTGHPVHIEPTLSFTYRFE